MKNNRSQGLAHAGMGRFVLILGLTFLPALLATGCAVPQPRGEGRLTREAEPKSGRGYWLYLPQEYVAAEESARRARRWPLVVTFHGMKPFDNARPQALEWEQEADRFGYIVIAPELRAPDVLAQFPVRTVHSSFKGDEDASLAIMDHVIATYGADPNNVLATSWSSGGYMAHYMLNRHPDKFTCLAVRQSNFSSSVLDAGMTSRSAYHPILIVFTQNDFAICIRESHEAIRWYHDHGYKNMFWAQIRAMGHERTPDMAADFFGKIARVEPNRMPEVLVTRQAIDGNTEGLAFLAGKLGDLRGPAVAGKISTPPAPKPSAPLASGQPTGQTPARPVFNPPAVQSPAPQPQPRPAAPVAANPTPPRPVVASATPAAVSNPNVVSIRVSSAIGIEPLNLAYSAECPADWSRSADFLWTLNGAPIGSSVNGHKLVSEPGEHSLSVLVVTADGREHRATRMIRVLPRMGAAAFSTGND